MSGDTTVLAGKPDGFRVVDPADTPYADWQAGWRPTSRMGIVLPPCRRAGASRE